jgi:hypothetical protein
MDNWIISSDGYKNKSIGIYKQVNVVMEQFICGNTILLTQCIELSWLSFEIEIVWIHTTHFAKA